MDLRDADEDRRFRSEVRAFVAARLPDDIRRKVLGFLRVEREDYVRWQRILFERGWGAPGWPLEWGGCGWNAVQRNIFDEECFTAGAPRQMPFGLSMIAPVLMKYGTPEQQARFLPRIVSMEDWWCQGYSEPGAGSDLASLKTRAERVGSNYVVTGQKIWTSFAQWANWMFALVRTDSSGKPQRGISLLLIPMDAKGISVRPIKTLDGGHDVNEVFLDAVEVPVENLMGVENDGWTIAKYLLGHERTTIAGLGMCKRLLRRLKEVARTQTRNARPLIDDPRFRDKVAKIEIDVLAHEWALARLISLEQAGRGLGAEPSMLKIRGSEIQGELGELLMECAGPYALPFLDEATVFGYDGPTAGGVELNPLAGLYLDLRKVAIYGGTNEIQRGLIGKSIVGV
ncbi:acyl-CoA dehydrogenase family protein [Piscinibacter sp.]|uniref:acyl-CoA dehydrogenase family protein n=1 Tax=Piscinibacter sp. TaxID=1903157 RepID=UPI002F3F7E71